MRKQSGKEPLGRARGFTATEVIVSVVVFGVVLTTALSFLQLQNRGLKRGLDYLSTIQTLRRVVGTLERDIQTAGTNLGVGQPEIVYAGEHVLAFNADYATGEAADRSAVFFRGDLDERVTEGLPRERKVKIPGTSFLYPDSTYRDRLGRLSPAETLIFFFSPDHATEREDDFSLYRQVNSEEPQLVADNLLRSEGRPFFRYLTEGDSGLDSIPNAQLPLTHTDQAQRSPADTGSPSLVDSIRGVRVTVSVATGKGGPAERSPHLSRIVRLPNMGFGFPAVCGSPPKLSVHLSATVGVSDATGDHAVTLAWRAALDEVGGERDVARYLIWRREIGLESWGAPYISIPAGEGEYIYRDRGLVPGRTYQYALAAQDCTPALSEMTPSESVTIPLS
jgi:prepilin-type N-terminal cleavage/methylation domain-containing protein